MEIRTVSLIGLGALGVMFGRQMAAALPPGDFRVVVDAARRRRYEAEGVYANGARCDFTYTAPDDGSPPADLLLFAVKYGALPAAIEAARSHVGERTALLSLLNGIQSEEDLAAAYGREKVLYCVAQGMDAVKVGNELTYRNMGKLLFGEADGRITPRVEAVRRLLHRAGIAWETPADMKKTLWSKFMLNAGVNQVAALFHTTYGGLQREGPARQMMLRAMEEVRQVALCEGVALTPADIDAWMVVLDGLDPEGLPSMRQDFDARRPSEVELFAGTARRLGQKHGVLTPVNDEIYRRVGRVEAAYWSGSPLFQAHARIEDEMSDRCFTEKKTPSPHSACKPAKPVS